MNEPVTINTIMNQFETWVQGKNPIPPSLWLDGAIKMAALMGNLDDELIEAKMAVNRSIAAKVESGDSVAKATILTEAEEIQGEYLKKKAKREQVEQFIMLAKKRCSLQSFDQ